MAQVTKKCCRYEFFIPLYYNDSSPIEAEKLYNTTEELMRKFCGLTTYPSTLTVSGLWKEQDEVYQDKLLVFMVDSEESKDDLRYIFDYKEKLKQEYKQKEIYITRQKIEIV
jgi:hypothetical protein